MPATRSRKGSYQKITPFESGRFVLFLKLILKIRVMMMIIYLTAVVVFRELVVILGGSSRLVAENSRLLDRNQESRSNSFAFLLLSDNNWKPGCRLCVSPSLCVHTNSIFGFFRAGWGVGRGGGLHLSAICPCTNSSTYPGAACCTARVNFNSRLGCKFSVLWDSR